ncbi:hypothetical protein ACFU8Q_37445 [Streptomyces sp. NPDC057543]|uniref:hypothetical protein n=1 Tax=Streptomyces sp. NPDC057543 TaxID=3346163 RepID=UPI0036A1135A
MLIAEPGRGYRRKDGTPVCSNDNDGPPSNALIGHSMPDQTNTYSRCGTTGTDAGHFQFTFYPDRDAIGPGLGQYEAKGDLYQIGGGYDGHFWYAHTRDTAHLGGDSGLMTIKGTWTLDESISLARVLVHLPDTGAHTRQAAYKISGADTTSDARIVEQRAGRWASLGAFHFTGTPQVTLTNATADGTADEDVAWDSVAFQPLPGKPNHEVVAMGDSYSASPSRRSRSPLMTAYRPRPHRSRRQAETYGRLPTLPLARARGTVRILECWTMSRGRPWGEAVGGRGSWRTGCEWSSPRIQCCSGRA